MSERRGYRTSEFAKLTGVTVRTLHHYDRLGLLTPGGRTTAGYRLYGEGDFARLQQIVTLKFIGFSLKQIREILSRGTQDLATRLRQQREILEQKRSHLTLAVQAIAKAERLLASNGEGGWQAFQKIIEVINMQNDNGWMMRYYSEEARQEMAERPDQWTPEMQEKVSQEWAVLINDVKAAIANQDDPASENAQALAARWSELVGRFTMGSPAISEGLKKLYADQANWPSTFEKPYSDEVGAFICEAQTRGKGEAQS
jgi:MerR family transcriptional regulator, thiopeptide resistance regulator